jgi:redox-sensitive bicupin YhaK (pirin superfamily)
MSIRKLAHVIDSVATSDGAGVKLRRSLGARQGLRLDPFLMLDEFSSEEASDYIAGFPPHPHRGFETVTYMLDGHMRHEDNFGHRGELKSGGVQWMTAGRGIVHSEMPQQESGRMRGFQLWINLPAAEKMKPAAYRDIPPSEIPTVALDGGGTAKVIAGSLGEVDGPINPRGARISTDPTYIDVELPPGATFRAPVAVGYTAFVYAFEGAIEVGGTPLRTQQAGALGDGDTVEIAAGPDGARFILLAAKPLREPVVQYGPFVMNTQEEIEQAIADYQRGNFGHAVA